jgi:hypothetical protein
VAKPAEAGDHLVEDQENAVRAGDLAQALEIALGAREHAGRAGHRLDDHRGDRGGVLERSSARSPPQSGSPRA